MILIITNSIFTMLFPRVLVMKSDDQARKLIEVMM